ncbi:MAG: hypothetical protein Pg6B_10060 [Candidatus Azobacteroides pseudotrichonymphae]|nr:MAG: hypothetical protein Pg6B_10060 [Candidatus Azobacteroides pseudotrichonymphae]
MQSMESKELQQEKFLTEKQTIIIKNITVIMDVDVDVDVEIKKELKNRTCSSKKKNKLFFINYE